MGSKTSLFRPPNREEMPMRGEMSRKTPKFRDKPRRRKKMSRKTPQNRDKNTSAQRIPNKNLYNSAIITTFARSNFF